MLRLLLAIAMVCAVALTWVRPAQANRPVIEAGREKEVLALFHPHELGADVVAPYKLWSISIERTEIRVEVRTDEADPGQAFLLRHPDFSDSKIRSPSFAIEDQGPSDGPASAAVQKLIGALQRNDTGGFWRIQELPRSDSILPGPSASYDGIHICVGILLLLAGLTFRALQDSPRWVGQALLAITTAGAAVRWAISPVTLLGAWPFSRIPVLPRLVFEGPTLASLSADTPIYFTDVIHWVTFGFAVAAPVALFVHARYLVGDARVALLAAGMLAVLPMHIRFSRSEVAFIPSLVISSTCLALAHAALRDASRAWRVSALVLLPILIWGMMTLRPLNALFVGVLLGVGLLLRRKVPRRRLALVMLVGCGAGTVAAVSHLLSKHAAHVSAGLSATTLLDGLGVLVDLEQNTLINPWITPPLLGVLVLVGGYWLWRRQRELALLLVAWLVVFLVAHAYVVPSRAEMGARYHLHLLVPFLLLAAAGVGPLLAWARLKGTPWVLGAYIVASPLLHHGFISDTDFNEQREYAFVTKARAQVAEGCTIFEYVGGPNATESSRFARLGQRLQAGKVSQRFDVHSLSSNHDPLRVPPPHTALLAPAVKRALAEPGQCTMVYLGLRCAGLKPRDLPTAPVCAALRQTEGLTLVAATEFQNRHYDMGQVPGLLKDEGSIRLELFRVGAD